MKQKEANRSVRFLFCIPLYGFSKERDSIGYESSLAGFALAPNDIMPQNMFGTEMHERCKFMKQT